MRGIPPGAVQVQLHDPCVGVDAGITILTCTDTTTGRFCLSACCEWCNKPPTSSDVLCFLPCSASCLVVCFRKQFVAFKNLLKRNGAAEASGKTPTTGTIIHLPFIIINTNKAANINCQMAGDKQEYYFDFNQPFEIHDDMEVLKRMGLGPDLENGTCSAEVCARAPVCELLRCGMPVPCPCAAFSTLLARLPARFWNWVFQVRVAPASRRLHY